MGGRLQRARDGVRRVFYGAERGAERTTIRAGNVVEDVTPTHGAHPSVIHADAHPHANLDDIAGRPAPHHVEVPTVPDKLPGRIKAVGKSWLPGARTLGTTGVAVYAGVQAVDRFNRTADAVGDGAKEAAKAALAVPEKALEAAQAALAASYAAAEKAALAAAAAAGHATEGPEAMYKAMLAEIHELEAGAKRGVSSVTGSGQLSTALAVVTVAGSAYTALQFYRAYKS